MFQSPYEGSDFQDVQMSGLGQPTAPAATRAAVQQLTRVRNTALQPLRWICRIHVRTYKGGSSIGTGVLISRYHVLTCAHVLYPLQDPRPREVSVLPGQAGPDDRRPRIRANGWAVSPGWRWNACLTADQDLAIIRLARPVNVGFWSIAAFEPSTLAGATALLAGYPALRGDRLAHWMYWSRGPISGRIQINSCTEPTQERQGSLNGRIFRDIQAATRLIAHTLDTRPSMSGGPMWINREGRRLLVALHAGDIAGGAQKKAILLNATARNRIAEWMRRTLPPLR